ncbi:MAG: M36 family metallopeptidase [Verrucomicrobiaceae bacterium]|nr:M36 family metallopeptidase [Verrucomicrobiaceae bacterium]
MKRHSNSATAALGVALLAAVLVVLLCLLVFRSRRSGPQSSPDIATATSPAPVDSPGKRQEEPRAGAPRENPARDIMSRLKPKALPDIDARKAAPAPPPSRQAAALALRKNVPGVKIDFDAHTGTPANVTAPGRFLSRPRDAAAANDPHGEVRRFLDENAALFGHDAALLDAAHARVSMDDVTAHSGLKTMVWAQQLDGIPLFKTILKANLSAKNELVAIGSHFLADPAGASGKTAAERAALISQPPVDARRAVSLAAASVNDLVPPGQVTAQGAASGAEQKQHFAAPGISDTYALLTWMPVSDSKVTLAWDVTSFSLARNEMFRTVVDAESGEILNRTSLTNDATDASFRVWADATTKKPFDSPNPMLPGTPTPSGVQGVEVPRQLVTLQSADATASPNGWINDGGQETLGNNVDAHTDTNADNQPDLPRPNGGASRVFDFPIDLTAQAPGQYKDASVTQLFYINNWMHDQLYGLGFTETSRNFQTNNFGRGGLGNDAVLADAQDGSGTNNANMSTPGDGSPPRMQMYIFPSPNPDRDGDFDDIIVLHEYTHGLSNRLVGGGVGISATATGGMGEGWSDFYGLALLADPNSDPNAVYPGGSYATLQFVSGMMSNYYYGIRRYPYCTDMSKNPLTFRDIDPTQASPHTGIPLSPLFGSSNSNPGEVHNVGEVWCMALWECRANLITKYGAAGNQKVLQLVTDAMKLCPVNPNLLQSRDAIIQADLVAFGGANRNELWAAFAKRGMGASATAPASSTTTGVVEAFDMPDDLSVSPLSTFAAAGPVGGPFNPAVQTYTLTNNGTSALTWTAGGTQSWITASPAGGTLASGASTTVTVTFNTAANALTAAAYSGAVRFTNNTSGITVSAPVTLSVGAVDYFTELFTSGNDTDNQSWLFTPNGSPSFYSVARTASVSSFSTDPTGGTNLSLGDDSYSTITLSGGSTVKLYGTSYSTFYVGSNGYVTFGSSDSTLAESLVNHFAYKRVAALFDDLNPSAGGTVSWRQLADRVAVTFQGVPEYNTTNSNDFQIELFFDGRIRISCLAISAVDGLIGLSQGTGTPANFVMSNFNTYPTSGGGGAATLALSAPATSTEGAGVLTGQGSVTLSASQASDVVVTLASTNTNEITVPTSVTVLAGQTSATFDITVIDDALLDGTQSVILTAGASGFATVSRVMAVNDNDGTGVLTISAPASTTEGAGSINATLTLSAAPAGPLPVTMSSSDATAIAAPATVVVPAGQTTLSFPLTVVDDNKIDGPQTATVTAHVNGWTDGATGTITVADNENTNLAITLPTSVTEGGTGTGTVVISGTLPSALVVALSSDTTSRLTVPATATIAAGATSASFTLAAPNNTLTDGSATVAVSASASGFTGASFNTTVLDNDVHHYSFGTIASPQTRGVPFSVTINALDVNGVTIASYTGTPSLTGAGTGGAVTVTPTTTTAFVAGVWTGNVTVGTFDSNVVLTASDGSGHTGASNAFNVTTGALHHFAWNTQAARAVNAPVSATITAQDAGNNTLTGFTGTTALSGYVLIPQTSGIVISEVNPNTPDEVEFKNIGTGSVDISGWQIYLYDNVSWPAPMSVFTIPSGTICASGEIFRLQENGTSPGAYPLFYKGANVDWTSAAGSQCAVLLRNAAGTPVDFVAAAASTPASITSPQAIPSAQWTGAQVAGPTNTAYDYQRIGSTDGNTAGDWTTATPGIGTTNTGQTFPFSAPAAVFITPTISGAFTSGVWTGNVAVLQPAQQMRLRADDGSAHVGDSNAFDVFGTLSLSVPASAPEGSAPVTGTVSVSSAPAGDLTVTLTSSDITAATVPATVTILSGQTSATFPITIIDDAAIDGTQVAAITAHITSWADATANISVLDNETLSLAVFVPGTIAEGTTATGTVSASGTVAAALTVNLASDNTPRLTVPATVTIASGTASTTFTATAVDNALTDGSAPATVTAAASGYTSGSSTTTVLDNDVHHFGISAIAAPQTKGVPFAVTITAYDSANNVLTGYNGAPALSAAGTAGSVVISPTNASGFISGVWAGQVTAYGTDTNVVVTVNDGAGHTGASNTFNIINPTSVLTVVEPVTPLSIYPGQNPRAPLVVGADGSLYGTTQTGGGSNQGTVFKITTAGVMTTLVNFYGANGMQPYAGLVLASDGNFYGTTSAGGANNLGTIFKMTPSGVLTTLVHLSTSTGTAPRAPLVQHTDGNFYGTTSAGGSSSSGTIFKMTSAGVLTVLVNFTGTGSTAYGSSCQAGLIKGTDNNLYGVTSAGGSGGGFGTVFKVTTGGTFTSLASFTGTTGAALGSAPLAALLQAADGNLYGTTSAGGTGGFGTVFKITTAGVFTNLLSFTNTTGSFLGNNPQSALIQWSDGNLYGMTNTGGANSIGTIFRVTTAGVLTTLRSLVSSTDGANPYGALVLHSDGNFYGTANAGSTQARGTVFRFAPGTSTFTRILSFTISPPYMKNMILASDGNFYGGAANGNAGLGSVFKQTPAGVFSTPVNFISNNFGAPYLLEGTDGNLYGTQPTESSNGEVFRLSFAGGKTTLATLTGTSAPSPGTTIIAGMIEATDGYLYGVTSGGGTGGGFGTVFKVSPGDGTFTSLTSFTGTSGIAPGSTPQTKLVEGADGALYGTTQSGGAGNFGTVFKVSTGGVMENIVQFTGTTGGYLGTSPNSNLLLAGDGNFYGTTSTGGTGNFGSIYRIAPDGTFTSLVSFTSTSGSYLGSTPTTNLVQGSDGNLYGTTTGGGSGGGNGTVFKLALPSGTFTSLVSFTGTSGAAPGATPHATLRQGADGYFYGTTSGGGFFGLGTVFRVNAAGIFQSLYQFGTNNDGGSPNLNGSSSFPEAYRLVAGGDGYLYGTNGSTVFRVHQQPAIQSVAASGVTTTGATLNGSVTPNQDGATAYYQYGVNTNYGSQTAPQTLAAGTAAVPVNASLAGLLPGTVYHYRLVTVTSQGTFYTADQTFATAGAPLVITGSLVVAAQTGFSLDGVVNPLGSATSYYFEYGADTSYGASTTTQSAGSGVNGVPVSTTVNGLVAGTTYHVRLVATNSVGTTNGDDQTITTFAASSATVQPMAQHLNTGTSPLASLFKGADGAFYGTTSTGGTFGSGTVFRMSQGGTLATLANFYNNTNGALSGSSPQAAPVQGADGNFYGTTNSGGAFGSGCIYKMTPAGQVTVLVSFRSTSVPLGSNPAAMLALGADGNFYGTTQNGGSSSLGTIFKVTPAGVLTTLVSFTGTTGANLGSSPRAGLTLGADGNFYGTTATGGAGGFGTIFKVTPAGVFTTLVQFTGTAGSYPGSTPLGALVLGADGNFYGTTSLGGASNLGTVFKLTPGATFTQLATFTGTTGAVPGATPKGALIQMADGNFYGTTQTGGTGNFGTVFQITPAGVLTPLVHLTGTTGAALGTTPQGALVAGSDGALYGTTNAGGLYNLGSVFRVTTSGLFSTLVNFTGSPSFGRLIQGGNGALYGATLSTGGASGYGTLFSAPISGAPLARTTLAPVSGTTALNARAGLLLGADGNYYGTTVAGGAINSGSVFSLTPAGVYTTLLSFTGTSGANPGSSPQAALILGADGNFYGTASGGGSSSSGIVFKMTPAGAQTTLVNFTGTGGAALGSSPQGPLTLGSDGNYYGTTTTGGTGGSFGTVFKMTPGGALTTLVNFTGVTGAALGSSPLGVLAQGADGNFYGVTSSGGLNSLGSVFRVTPAGVFTSLASFTGNTGALPGSTPTGGLFPGADGCLYGVTSSGGAYGTGVLFRLSPDAAVTTLWSFSGRTDGITPNNGLAFASDGKFYGGNASEIYRFTPPPVVLTGAATNVQANSATLNGSITGEGYDGTLHFEYGPTTSYGSNTDEQDFAHGVAPQSVSAAVTDLQPFLTYHCRLVAFTSLGATYGQDQTFTTPSTVNFNDSTDVPLVNDGFNPAGQTLGISLGFAPAPGTILRLVSNTGFTPVAGTFNNLPDGGTITATFGAQTYLFVINYNGGDGNDVTLTLVTQAINFPAIPNKLTTDAPFTLGATATSGLPVTYAVTSGAASASVSGGTVTLTGTAGIVSITATQAGDGGAFGPAPQVTRTFAVVAGSQFIKLSSSKYFYQVTAGIKADGTLWSWGYGIYGQLGNGSTATTYTPTQVGTATNWSSVSVGGQHVLATKSDGTLWAWGYNGYGQLGDGTNTQRNSPVQIGTLTTWSAVAAGYSHSLALKTDGTLWACGYNTDGQLGQGTSDSLTTHTALVQVGTATNWSGIASGNYHLLATRTDGTLWAWGYNAFGQIGNASTTSATSPVQITSATNWSSISGGYYHSLATRADGTLWAWGRNTEGQIGDGTTTQRTSPLQIGAATNWQKVMAGGFDSMALKTNGTLWSWGSNFYGQLGQGVSDATVHGTTPTQVGTATNWSLVAPGYYHTVATRSDGTTWSWGNNTSGELGYATANKLLQPVAAQFGAVASASGGSGHTVILKPDGTLWLAGYNSDGQLGIGSTDSGEHPVLVQPLPGTRWISASAGGNHTAAVRNDGTLWTWGYNNYGQLGDGTTVSRSTAGQVGTDANWVSVACGFYFTIGLRADGTLWAWGYNSDGQMGNGTTNTTGQFAPVQVGTATNWASVTCGGYHVLATKQDGSLWGWGRNIDGQLGDGTTTSRSSPVQVGSATTWRAISAGQYHTIATRTDGTLWAWGYNGFGQIGDGTNTSRSSPVQIGTGTTWKSVGAGFYHSVATKTDGSLWTWGYNFYNQLGDAGTTNRNSPTRVGTGSGWSNAFRTFNHFTLVTSGDESLWGCGYTPYGQTGYAWRNQLVPDTVIPGLSAPQTVAFPAVPRTPVGSTVTLAATSSSGLPVRYIISGPGVLTDARVTVTGPGMISVFAWQPGDNFFQSSDMAVQYINPPAPDIAIEQPEGAGLTDGVSTVDFGAPLPTQNTTRTFTIRNTGDATLTITTATIDGANSGDFAVGTLPSTLAPAASATFTVTFTPPALGTRTAVLHIASNDTHETPFDIALAGVGATEIESWRQQHFGSAANSGSAADNADPDGDGIKNLMEFALGTSPTTNSTDLLPIVSDAIKPGDGKHYPTISYRRRITPGTLNYALQSSPDLTTWTTIPGVNLEQVGAPVATGDGITEVVTFRVLPAIDDSPAPRFVRLSVTN